jgi:hypothetical protein
VLFTTVQREPGNKLACYSRANTGGRIDMQSGGAERLTA